MSLTPSQFDKLKKIRKLQRHANTNRNKKLKVKKSTLNKEARNKRASIKLMENQLKLNSPNECIFRAILIENGIKHIWQKPFYDEKRYVCVDFYFPKVNIVVEIDGFEHEDRKQYDLERTMYLKKVHGVKEVLRVTNKELALTPDNIRNYLLDKVE